MAQNKLLVATVEVLRSVDKLNNAEIAERVAEQLGVEYPNLRGGVRRAFLSDLAKARKQLRETGILQSPQTGVWQFVGDRTRSSMTLAEQPPKISFEKDVERRADTKISRALTLLLSNRWIQGALVIGGLIGIPPNLHYILQGASSYWSQEENWTRKVFEIPLEKGSLTFGKCPGPDCLHFQLGEVETSSQAILQNFQLSGGSLFERIVNGEHWTLHVKAKFQVRHSSVSIDHVNLKASGVIPLIPGEELQICSTARDLKMRITSVGTESLGLELSTKAGTWRSIRTDLNCIWMDEENGA